ncbi:GNAT family N-acetyltransferase [Jannaschia sp. CCS1]|uniref:GNAT family N-acetyltransferase n=1 Tax=Jannaschia sp. (strain CCS1) TaxID=290400 RepID=UPI00006C0056|nr:GNAT family N-acetyltransferase [Jannaschia sp. CCS1]ABD55427.1 GCN5-related N-acetyltransferase [Jannaschia sp. CCS1]
MDLRPAIPSDLPEIARLHEANWRRDYVGILPEVVLGAPLSAHMAKEWTVNALDTRRVFVMVDGGSIVGFAAMQDDGPHECAFLDNLHVEPSARAQGVGRALMSAVAVLAVPGALTLDVLSANTAARAIYRRWGGQESVEFDDEVLGVTVPAVTVGWRNTVDLLDRLRGQGR